MGVLEEDQVGVVEAIEEAKKDFGCAGRGDGNSCQKWIVRRRCESSQIFKKKGGNPLRTKNKERKARQPAEFEFHLRLDSR
jgi:hypothetical protein